MWGTGNKSSKSQQPDLTQWGIQNTNTLTTVSSVLQRFLQCCPHRLQIQGNLIPVGSQSTLFLFVSPLQIILHLLRLYRAFSVESDLITSLCLALRMSPIATTSTRLYDSPSLPGNGYQGLFRRKQTFESVDLTTPPSFENKNAYIHSPRFFFEWCLLKYSYTFIFRLVFTPMSLRFVIKIAQCALSKF